CRSTPPCWASSIASTCARSCWRCRAPGPGSSAPSACPATERNDMIRGTVIGHVWAARKARGLEGQTHSLVAARDADGRATGRLVVASDTLDARDGEAGTVAVGCGAGNGSRPG